MKKVIKNNIFGFILGGIIFGSIVYASSYLANDISYQPEDLDWKVNTVNEALNDLRKESLNKSVSFTYSGGGYMRKDQRASSSAVIFNDDYKKISVNSGTVSVMFNYLDGTSSSAVSLNSGNSLQIPENVESIACSSSSDSIAGDDGFGGQWLSGTATITLE